MALNRCDACVMRYRAQDRGDDDRVVGVTDHGDEVGY